MRFAPQAESGRWSALAFTLFVHGLLLIFLFLGVQWKRNPPPSVAVELWAGRPQAATPSPPPPPRLDEPSPRPPEPSRPETRTPPAESQPVVKPDIAIRQEKKEKTRLVPPVEPPKKQPKPEERQPVPPKKEAPKEPVEPPPPRLDFSRHMQSEATARAIDKEIRGARDQAAASAASQSALGEWTDGIKGKIRGNTVQPPSLRGNPVAVFRVGLLPSGDVISVRLTRSSGQKAWDEATERAIWKSSPLPKPKNPAVFDRDLELKLCPDEQQGCS